MNSRSRRHTRRPQKLVGRVLRRVFVEPFFGLGELLERSFAAFSSGQLRSWPGTWGSSLKRRFGLPWTNPIRGISRLARKLRLGQRGEPDAQASIRTFGLAVWTWVRFQVGHTVYLVGRRVQRLGQIRHHHALLLALPALLVGLACLGLLVASASLPATKLIQRYEARALEAYSHEDFVGATTYYEKLCRLAPDEDHFLFMLGLIAERQGNSSKAMGIMTRLAPPDRTGFGRAHLWIAKRQMGQLQGHSLEEVAQRELARGTVERHLQLALQDDDQLWEAKLLLGQLLVQREPERAIKLLEQVGEAQPRTALILANLQRRQGRDDESRQTLEAYLPHVLEQIQTGEPESRVAAVDEYVRCLLSLQRFAAAEDFIRQHSTQLGRDNSRLEFSRVHYCWAVAELAAGSKDQSLERVVTHLDDALRFDPGNMAALQLLVDLLQRDVGQQRQIVDLLLDTMVNNRATAITYIVLGNYYSRIGDTAQSMRYYTKASSRVDDPRLQGSIYNNIAWVNLQQVPPNASAAQEWIEKAFATGVVLPEYHDTRGQALALLGRWEAARDDLEIALGELRLLDDFGNPAERAKQVRLLIPTVQAMIRCQIGLHDTERQHRYEQQLEELENLASELDVADVSYLTSRRE